MSKVRERPGSTFSAAGSGSATFDGMPEIPEEELRNNIAEILRRAEAGEEFTITASGQPVAKLGPIERRRWVPSERLGALSKMPVDPTLAQDLEGFEFDIGNPWEDK